MINILGKFWEVRESNEQKLSNNNKFNFRVSGISWAVLTILMVKKE